MMEFYRQHLLSIITYTPLVGAVVLMFLPRKADNAARWIANLFGVIGFLVSLPLWFWFDRAHPTPFQFEESASWIPSIGVSYHFGVDGISTCSSCSRRCSVPSASSAPGARSPIA
jgi:NADH-quinone oxidoreductase subunit M